MTILHLVLVLNSNLFVGPSTSRRSEDTIHWLIAGCAGFVGFTDWWVVLDLLLLGMLGLLMLVLLLLLELVLLGVC